MSFSHGSLKSLVAPPVAVCLLLCILFSVISIHPAAAGGIGSGSFIPSDFRLVNRPVTASIDWGCYWMSSFDFDDGFVRNWAFPNTVTHSYTTPGEYTIKAIATDDKFCPYGDQDFHKFTLTNTIRIWNATATPFGTSIQKGSGQKAGFDYAILYAGFDADEVRGTITSPSGGTVGTPTLLPTSGSHRFEWDGAGATADGEYTLTLTVKKGIDTLTFTHTVIVWNILYVDHLNTANSFMNFKSGTPADAVATFQVYPLTLDVTGLYGARLLNASGGVVKTLTGISSLGADNKYQVTWDGKDAAGVTTPGKYYIQFYVTKGGVEYSGQSDLIVVWAETEEVDTAWRYFKTIGEKESFYDMLERASSSVLASAL